MGSITLADRANFFVDSEALEFQKGQRTASEFIRTVLCFLVGIVPTGTKTLKSIEVNIMCMGLKTSWVTGTRWKHLLDIIRRGSTFTSFFWLLDPWIPPNGNWFKAYAVSCRMIPQPHYIAQLSPSWCCRWSWNRSFYHSTKAVTFGWKNQSSIYMQ